MNKKIFFTLLLLLAGSFTVAPRSASAQVDMTELAGNMAELANQAGIDPTMFMRSPTPDEWRQFWQLVDSVMKSDSVEELAWLSPYARLALDYLNKVPEARPYADWLSQRMDYLTMAEEIVREEHPNVKIPPVKSSTGKITITQPPPKPSAASAARTSKKAMDVDRWVKRVGKHPPPKGASQYVPILKPIFRQYGVPEQLVWLAEVESSFDPLAKSPVGALGLYQFMPSTAQRFGLSLKPKDQRAIPEHSASAAAQYLKLLHDRFGSWPLALAAYNAGEGRVGSLLSKHKANSFEGIAEYLPAETRMYVPKVSAVVKVREGVDLKKM